MSDPIDMPSCTHPRLLAALVVRLLSACSYGARSQHSHCHIQNDVDYLKIVYRILCVLSLAVFSQGELTSKAPPGRGGFQVPGQIFPNLSLQFG
jgi:hypothetical protein